MRVRRAGDDGQVSRARGRSGLPGRENVNHAREEKGKEKEKDSDTQRKARAGARAGCPVTGELEEGPGSGFVWERRQSGRGQARRRQEGK